MKWLKGRNQKAITTGIGIIGILMVIGVFSQTGKDIPMKNKSYVAVNPPIESGEMVIEELEFSKDLLTMKSGDVVQSVEYQWTDGQLIMCTKFGEFPYDVVITENGLLIDGVEYIEQE